MQVPRALRPDDVAPTGRQSQAERAASPRRKYSVARGVVGALGIALPFGLAFGEAFLDGSFDRRGSLSAYYHSGIRDYFVATLVIVGVLLIIYKFFQYNLDNTVTVTAGVAAIFVALFPTHVPDGLGLSPTPLQDKLGEGVVAGVHYTAAVVFFLCMAVMSVLFGRSERARAIRPRLGWLAPSLWRRKWLHWICAAFVIAAVVLLVATRWIDVFGDRDIVVAESTALVAFGLSWAYKGFELDLLMPSLDRD